MPFFLILVLVLLTALEMLVELLRREKELNIKPDPFIDALMKARS